MESFCPCQPARTMQAEAWFDTSQICINPFPIMPLFLCVYSTSLLKTVLEKEKLLVKSNFSLSHTVFYPFGELPTIFIKLKIVVCKLVSVRRVSNLLFGKGLSSIFIGHTSKHVIDWLIQWCFQRYFSHITATAHILHVFPGFHLY